MNVRMPLAVAVVAVAALAGCSSTEETATTPATTASASAPAPRATTLTPVADGACTPSETTLLKALAGSKVGDALAPSDTLADITCYQGWALAGTRPKEADNAEVVFHYTGGKWQAVNGGTSGYCDGFVPKAVRPHLKRC